MALNKKNIKTNASEVAKTEATKGEKSVVENILIDNLIADENNGEDITVTSDLEVSIKENGFIGSIVVTDFGMESGKYRIVSGHRRTEAMKKLGYKAIPCQIKEYVNEEEVAMARISMNTATRDSEKNPLLFVQRWLNFCNTVGNKLKEGEKVERFSGITALSTSHIQNHIKPASRLIPELSKLCLYEDMGGYGIGVSSFSPFGIAFSEEEQRDIYENIISVCIAEGKVKLLTRDNCEAIKKLYKNGVKTWAEIENELVGKKDSHGEKNANNEADIKESRNDFDGMNPPVEESDDESDFEEKSHGKRNDNDTDTDADDVEDLSEAGVDEGEVALEKKERKLGDKVVKNIESLYNILSKDFYNFGSEEETSKAITLMFDLASELLCRANEKVEETKSDMVADIYTKAFNEFKTVNQFK